MFTDVPAQIVSGVAESDTPSGPPMLVTITGSTILLQPVVKSVITSV